MRHLPILLGTAVLGVCLSASSGQASAAPLLPSSASDHIAPQIQKTGYYRGWNGYGYWHRPYGYRPWGYSYGPWGYAYRYGHGPYRRYGWRY